MKKLIITFCAIIASMILITTIWGKGWIFFHDGPYRGKVVDAETGKPIEGVAVAGMWRLDAYGGPAGPVEVYCDARETVTDKNGEFIVPKAFCFNVWPFTKMGLADVVIFKPGYLGYSPIGSTSEERKAEMPDFSGEEFRNKKQYNVIKLGRPKTRQDSVFTLNSAEGLIYDETRKKIPFLLKRINEERKNLGFVGEWADKIGDMK